MTKRSRLILLGSVLLAASVIATAGLWMIGDRGARSSTSTILISFILVLTSIISVISIYLVKIRRTPDEKKLNEAFFREFEQIKDSIMNAPIAKSDKKNIREDVLEILLTAQANGKTVQASVGDTESFIKDIISACISKPRRIIFVFMDGVIAFILFIVCINALQWLENLSNGFFKQTIDISMLLLITMISFFFIPLIRQLTRRKSALAYLIPLAVGVTFIGIAELLRAFFYEFTIVKTILDGLVVMIPNPAALIAYLTVLLILFTVRLYLRVQPKKN